MRRQPNSKRCFICGVENVGGVRVAFFDTSDEDGRPEVEARFTGRDEHQGYPGRMHGGVATGILDETIGRAINASAGDGEATVWGVAADLRVRFRQPVPLGVELVARGRLTREARRLFDGTGEIYLPDGTIAVSASGRFVRLELEEISPDADLDELGWKVYDELP